MTSNPELPKPPEGGSPRVPPSPSSLQKAASDLDPKEARKLARRVTRNKSVLRSSDGTPMLRADINDAAANAKREFPNNYVSTAKYTFWTFLPKNLFEQFRRGANLYFFFQGLLVLIPGLTPVSPITTWFPLIFILGVAAIKDAIEDRSRHKADRETNEAEYHVIRDGKLSVALSQDIMVGDIVALNARQQVPADMLLLAASGEEGVAYLETSNIDGETNLKRRKAPVQTAAVLPTGSGPERDAGLAAASTLKGFVEYELPNPEVYAFTGRVNVGGNIGPLDPDNVLLRGANVRNTKLVYGLVLYAGIDTKMMLNQKTTPSRFSKFEKTLNRMMAIVFVAYMIMTLTSCLLGGFMYQANYRAVLEATGAMDYLDLADDDNGMTAFRLFFTFFLLLAYMIPMSLFVSIELVRLAQSYFMQWDVKMPGMQARNSNINEELGQIEHIFSDKTGTLTQNIMKLARFYCSGNVYNETDTKGSMVADLTPGGDHSEEHVDFLRALALCHTVVPEREPDGTVVFQAQSPDEAALVDAALDNKVALKRRHGRFIDISVLDKPETWELLATLEFNSFRKRMSVLVKNKDTGEIKLYSKGADIVMEPLIKEHTTDERIDGANKALTTFSKAGFRTLIIAGARISEPVAEEWLKEFHEAENDISRARAKLLDTAYNKMETQGLRLLGATAVEDKLQDQCPETIDYLLQAGIHVWVLTGDKQETAIEIGFATKLLNENMDIMVLNADDEEETGRVIRGHLAAVRQGKHMNEVEGHSPPSPKPPSGHGDVSRGLVIDGKTLGFALREYPDEFIQLGTLCTSLICCRVTPLQKALVVRLAKRKLGRICLAVGDGANDVSMIQEANVGVGIRGREGTQAVRSSDYAITQFQHLKPLIAVHGRYAYLRFSGLIQYSFYKNLVWIFPVLAWQFWAFMSGTALYEDWILTNFNVAWAFLPPVVYGIFEKDVKEEIIYKHPALYKPLQRDVFYNDRTMGSWLLSACWHAAVSFCIPFAAYTNGQILGNTDLNDGSDGGLYFIGTIVATSVVITVNLRHALFLKSLTWVTFLGIGLSYAQYFGFVAFLSTQFGGEWLDSKFIEVGFMMYRNPAAWLIIVLVVWTCLMMDLAVESYIRWFRPRPWMVLQEQGIKEGLPPLPEPTPSPFV